MASFSECRGYTMTELIIVIAVAAIIAVFAVPQMGRMRGRIRVRNGVNQVRSTIRLARSRAMANPRVHCGVHFYEGTQTITTFFDDNRNKQYDNGSDRTYQNPLVLQKDGVEFFNQTITNDVILFRGDGSAKDSAEIKIRDGKYTNYKIIKVVKQSGKVKVQ